MKPKAADNCPNGPLLLHLLRFTRFSGLKAICLTVLLVFTVCVSGYGQESSIRGSVLDESGEPVIGASVVIIKLQTGAATNMQGVYSISKIPAGIHELRVTYIGYDTAFANVEVKKGEIKTQKFLMLESSTTLDAVEISDTYFGKIRKRDITTGVIEITAKEINMLPSLGTPDLAQYLSVLPGVVSTGDQGGQVYIRGGTPIQNMVLLDGMIIYSPFHSMGSFSVFDTDYIRSVDLYSAAFPAQYGGRISSVMDVRTRNGNFKDHHVKAHINPVTAGFLVEGPFSKKNKDKPGGSSFLLSVRESHLNETSKSLYPYVNDSVGLPYRFLDIYGKTTFSDGGNYFSLFGYSHTDRVNYEFPSNFKWDSWGVGTKFMLLPENSNMILSGNFAYSSFQSGLQSVSEAFPRESLISGFNGNLNFSYIINSMDELTYGFNLLGFKTDYSFSNSFGLITQQTFNNSEFAMHVRYKKIIRSKGARFIADQDSIKDRMVIEPSIRAHYYNDHSKFMIEPRLRMKYNLNRVAFTFGTGMYSQNLISATSDRDVVNLFQGYLAAPQNVSGKVKNHALQTSVHAMLGMEVEIFKHMETTVEGWVKDFTQLTNTNRDKLFPDDPDFITETGIAYGIDFIAKYQNKNIYVYGTYGIAKVERTVPLSSGTQTYNPVFDRRHNVNVVFAYQKGKLVKDDEKVSGKIKFDETKWEASLRWNLGSGFPFTQTQGFFQKINFNDNGAQTDYQNQNGDFGILYADEINGGRLPYYHRLDISAKRRWAIKNKVLLEVNISVMNVYNRKNVFYFDRVRFAVINQLPILPSTGLTVKF